MKKITVKGMGQVSRNPDLIVVSMKLVTEDKEYDKTMESAAERITRLNDAMVEIGFEKEAVKTTNFSVRTDYENVRNKDGSYKNVLKGYVCNHNLKIEFDFDMKRLAKVLASISQCLATPEFSISFTLKNPAEIQRELLISATQNAKEKAEILCEAAGEKLGELVSIDYNWGEIDVFSDTDVAVGRSLMTKAAVCFGSVDIEPDDIRVNDTATFTWEIR